MKYSLNDRLHSVTEFLENQKDKQKIQDKYQIDFTDLDKWVTFALRYTIFNDNFNRYTRFW